MSRDGSGALAALAAAVALLGCPDGDATESESNSESTGPISSTDATVGSTTTTGAGSSDTTTCNSRETAIFEPLSPLRLGPLVLFDVEGDGTLELVGRTGAVVSRAASGLVVTQIAPIPVDRLAYVGDYDGDLRMDLLYVADDPARASVLRDVATGARQVSETELGTASVVGTGDVNGDLLDDLVTLDVARDERLQVHLATNDATFVLAAELDIQGFVGVGVAGGTVTDRALVVTTLSSATAYELLGSTLEQTGILEQPSLSLHGTVFGVEGGPALLVSSSLTTGPVELNAVGFAFPAPNSWTGWGYSLEDSLLTGRPTTGAVDRTGEPGIVAPTVLGTPAVELISMTPLGGELIGRIETQHAPESAGTLLNEDRVSVVYSTVDDGTWWTEFDPEFADCDSP